MTAPQGRKDTATMIKMEEELKERADNMAQFLTFATGKKMTRSELVRRALVEYLDKMEAKMPPGFAGTMASLKSQASELLEPEPGLKS